MKENLKPFVYRQLKQGFIFCDSVLFVERSGELCLLARLSTLKCGAEGKPSVNSAYDACIIKLVDIDPKPGDLSMSRLKLE